MPSALLKWASGWAFTWGSMPPPQSWGQRPPRHHHRPRCLQGLLPRLLPVSDHTYLLPRWERRARHFRPSSLSALLCFSLWCLLPLPLSSHMLVCCVPLSTGVSTPRGRGSPVLFITDSSEPCTAVPWDGQHSTNACWINACAAVLSVRDLKKILRELFKYYNLSSIFLSRKVLKFLYSRDFLSKALFSVMLLVWVYIRVLPN